MYAVPLKVLSVDQVNEVLQLLSVAENDVGYHQQRM